MHSANLYVDVYGMLLFFFKQKTAYEMRISDWSSDVCSSDLIGYALSNYLYSFVWQFGGRTFAMLPFALFGGVLCAFVIAPLIGRRTSKPKAAVWLEIGRASCRERVCQYV